MWRMLTGRAEDLEVRLAEHEAGDTSGSAIGSPTTPSRPAARVHNNIRAEFRLDDRLIAEHRDSFPYAWVRQALGWTPIVQGKVRREAPAGRDKFLARA